MRTALASLILAAGVVFAAQAQDATATQTAPAAPPQTAPAAAPQATPAAPAGAAAADPAAAAQPAAPAAQADPNAPQPDARGLIDHPPLPTSGDGAVILSVIEKVCVPIVRGQSLDDVAKAQGGWKRNRRDGSWTMPLGGDKAYQVTIFAQGANKNACQGEVRYAIGQEDVSGGGPIIKALNTWSFLHQPQLQLQANYVAVDADGIKRVRRSWEYYDGKQSIAVNFSTMKRPDDTPLNKRYDTGAIFYQERTF